MIDVNSLNEAVKKTCHFSTEASRLSSQNVWIPNNGRYKTSFTVCSETAVKLRIMRKKKIRSGEEI